MILRVRRPVPGEPPEGFELKLEFLDEEEHARLVAWFGSISFGEVRMRGVAAKRRVAQFGWRYSFETFRLSPAAPVPEELRQVRGRAAALARIPPEEFSEALVTEYPPGAGIGWHRDAPHFGLIAGISLGAACRMRFRRAEGEETFTAAAELPPRSIYLLTGSARKDWQHMIPPVREPRWSITFRTLRRPKGTPE
jgi:alkylated DNA repair dioxygenase AlkB